MSTCFDPEKPEGVRDLGYNPSETHDAQLVHNAALQDYFQKKCERYNSSISVFLLTSLWWL